MLEFIKTIFGEHILLEITILVLGVVCLIRRGVRKYQKKLNWRVESKINQIFFEDHIWFLENTPTLFALEKTKEVLFFAKKQFFLKKKFALLDKKHLLEKLQKNKEFLNELVGVK